MSTFNIKKSYQGFPSKTNYKYETGLTQDQAMEYLEAIERCWKMDGGLVVIKDDSTLIVEEGDGSNVITFEVIEIEY